MKYENLSLASRTGEVPPKSSLAMALSVDGKREGGRAAMRGDDR